MQNKILNKVSNDQDELLDNMIKVDSKVKALLTKTSICRLWLIIIIEIIIACFLLSMVTGWYTRISKQNLEK